MNFLTVLIAIGKVGSIWARKRATRKAYQTLVSLAVMTAIIHANKNKNGKGHKIN